MHFSLLWSEKSPEEIFDVDSGNEALSLWIFASLHFQQVHDLNKLRSNYSKSYS